MSLENLAGVERRASVSVPKQHLAAYRKCGAFHFPSDPYIGDIMHRRKQLRPEQLLTNIFVGLAIAALLAGLLSWNHIG